jgi:hypothetical protein
MSFQLRSPEDIRSAERQREYFEGKARRQWQRVAIPGGVLAALVVTDHIFGDRIAFLVALAALVVTLWAWIGSDD